MTAFLGVVFWLLVLAAAFVAWDHLMDYLCSKGLF